MDNLNSRKVYLVLFALLLAVLSICGRSQKAVAQSSYELLPAPDLWYNSVDGIRIGGRLRGQQAGTFGDGPHRLNLGFWVGTKFPENPVSYYISFTEPINAISDFGSEANIQIESLFRTGFQQHGFAFNKRWQNGFNEENYKELAVGFRTEHRFDKDYLLYSQLWQTNWLYLTTFDFTMTADNSPGRYVLSFNADANMGGKYDSFLRGGVSFQQKVELSPSFTLYSKLYSGFATEQTAPEYLFMPGLKTARRWMDKGLTRARGTMPPSWLESGVVQVTGAGNIRGYLQQNVDQLNNGAAPLLTSFSTLNLELDYPNPLDKAIDDIPVVGSFLDLRSYVFFDSGTSLGVTDLEEDRLLSDAGLGFMFTLNIPDYLGKPRGLMIRYDIPFWVSHPVNEESFKFRSVLGIGAVISL
ncbi:hypothetical protein [Fodinibius halophilus]|uniref:BamA/TamA family outer membrane protein n=1 Tax=Fodinibius halophilus TaxID=1736908 RepID=A0A6M1T945_9BACT|nr:hypothetical protein [Fodinibius halophilus]NGP89103.1 hypothetical protein [Fodinibius halophilus]